MHPLPGNPTAHEIHQWVVTELKDGVPPGVLHRYLQSQDTKAYSSAGLKAVISVIQKLFGPMVDRNIEGIRLEKAGDLAGAIRLYEANIKDGFDGSHPYDRLRIIYKKKKDFSAMRAACESFLKVSSQLKYPDQKLCEMFRKEIEKLETMNEESSGRIQP